MEWGIHQSRIRKGRQAFSQSEDETLKKLVDEFGENNWAEVASKMPHRNSRQCRDRWRGYLRPTLVNSQWTPEEDRTLLSKYDEFGPRWSVIGHFLPNRSEINIKNRWKLLVKYCAMVPPTQNAPNPNNMLANININNNIQRNPPFIPQLYGILYGMNVQQQQKSPLSSIQSLINQSQPQNCIISPSNNNNNIIIENTDRQQQQQSNIYYQEGQHSQQQNMKMVANTDESQSTTPHSSPDTSAAEADVINTPQDLEAFFKSLQISKLKNGPPSKY